MSGSSQINRKEIKQQKNENHVDIKTLPKYRLQEIYDRQKNLASNQAALAKLPDKGAKILSFKKEIENELQMREFMVNNLHEAMAGLSLNADLNEIEWTRKINDRSIETNVLEDDSDPVKILATHSGAGFHKKTVLTETESAIEPLIKDNDLEDVYAINLCSKFDKVETPINKFLPHKTLNRKKETCEVQRHDLSSATPPALKYGTLKLVSLEDSLKIQFQQAQILKAIQIKHASERLKDKTYVIGETMPNEESIKVYREVNVLNSDSDDDDEENEVGDDSEVQDYGGVVYTLEHVN